MLRELLEFFIKVCLIPLLFAIMMIGGLASIKVKTAGAQTITSVHTEQDRKYYVEVCKDEVIKQYSDEVSERELLDLLQECELDAQ